MKMIMGDNIQVDITLFFNNINFCHNNTAKSFLGYFENKYLGVKITFTSQHRVLSKPCHIAFDILCMFII
jgi:hypothetical protein